MHKRQRGVTLIGWIFLLIPVAVCVYAGIRLAPVYMNYGKVVRLMDQTADESSATDSQALLRSSLGKRVDIEGLEFPTEKDFTIRRDGARWIVEIDYEDSVPLLSNLSLTAKFSKSVTIGGSSE